MTRRVLFNSAACLLLLIFAANAYSYDFAGGTGEPNDPYLIATAEQLLSIGSDPNLINKCYILNNDINLDPNITGIPPFSQAPIAPYIDSSSIPFTGTFDGNDHITSEIVIDSRLSFPIDYGHLGVFGKLGQGCTIKNLGIENVNILCETTGYIGGLCGYNDQGFIIKCYATGSFTGDDSGYLGGLCGYNEQGSIINCHTTGFITVSSRAMFIGGLC